jgi:hypothetical protein
MKNKNKEDEAEKKILNEKAYAGDDDDVEAKRKKMYHDHYL